MTEQDTRLEMYELENSRNYFSTLESAAMHKIDWSTGIYEVHRFVGKEPKMEGVDENGFANMEEVIPLNELPEHIDRLKFVTTKLDKLPAEFWSKFNDRDTHELPYVAMQVWLWGTGNEEMSPELQNRLFGEIGEARGVFAKQVKIYETLLSDLDERVADNVRDHAEQCFRMLDAYMQLQSYFKTHPLPEGVTDF